MPSEKIYTKIYCLLAGLGDKFSDELSQEAKGDEVRDGIDKLKDKLWQLQKAKKNCTNFG
ncbi:MAG: hypothetical protein H5U06_08955 [Candidatus Aminicenantes bacterium]|nr:hypothetical protein [Candidatus Aminicenantes bacterium]